MNNIIAERYEIIQSLGSGGMADVYLAKDQILNREVAIKILKDSLSSDEVAVERFQREAMASTKLSHPNTVDIYDVGSDGNINYIAMEYVKGKTLKALIKDRGALDCKEALLIMKQICGAIMEAHRNGIIHRDIKPQNIIVQDDGTAKILDFGIAIANGVSKVTNNNSIIGSVHYLAPEIAKGKEASMKSDIYALGVVFFEMLSGDTPFKGDSAVAIALKHTNEQFPSIRKINPDVPISIENIIYNCCAKNPNDRYVNIAYLIKDLNSINLEITSSGDFTSNDAYFDLTKNDSSIENHEEEREKNEMLKTNKLTLGIISVISAVGVIISLSITFLILFIGGYISFGSNSITMPDITGYKLSEATDVLDAYSLSIDYNNVQRVISDDVDKGDIISTNPIAGSSINKGSYVTVVVSNGSLSVVDNYVGKDVETAKTDLEDLGFVVDIVGENDTSVDYGQVTKQTGFSAGDSYDPNVTNRITLYYREYLGMFINEKEYIGLDVNEVKNSLSQSGYSVKVELKTGDVPSGCESGKVCNISPTGTYYEQKGDNAITIKYYN